MTPGECVGWMMWGEKLAGAVYYLALLALAAYSAWRWAQVPTFDEQAAELDEHYASAFGEATGGQP